MSERTWMKKPCGRCPFARVGALGLHPKRAEDFASMAQNPFNDFPCHKTADYAEDEGDGSGGYVHGEQSFTCNGFLSLQVSENGRGPKGFEPHPDAFEDYYEMVEHHEDLWFAKGATQ
ncbi:hypothetical protein [Limimaricola cinnabarinus]|uniref:hypothetical protein n=1 Tax=Limimaricola cinnabarinus TaxID=1125964 RepID=UPI00249266BF|nr:hypothetical protein [Limimaricola cinnabarinus]